MSARATATYRVPNGIVYEEMTGFLTDGGVILRAQYRSTLMHLVEGADDGEQWLSIWSMVSAHEGRGDCFQSLMPCTALHGHMHEALEQAMIAQLRVEWPDHTLYGSIPISAAAMHIFIKHGIKFTMDDDVFDSFTPRSGP